MALRGDDAVVTASRTERAVIALCHLAALGCGAACFYYLIVVAQIEYIFQGLAFFGGAVGAEIVAMLVKPKKIEG